MNRKDPRVQRILRDVVNEALKKQSRKWREEDRKILAVSGQNGKSHSETGDSRCLN